MWEKASPRVQPGLEEFPLAPEINVSFVPRGRTLEPSPGIVVLDVGGGLGPGMLDHHQPDAPPLCAAELVAARPELVLDPFVTEARPVMLVTHSWPDLDAVCSTYFAFKLLAEGTLPDHASLLARYVGEIDQGHSFRQGGTMDTLYGLFMVSAHDISSRAAREGWEEARASFEILRVGFALLEHLTGSMHSGTDLNADQLFDDTRFQPARDRLKTDAQLYERDVARAELKKVPLPKRNGGTVVVGAMFIDDPESLFFKHWARTDRGRRGFPLGFPLLAVCYGEKRFIISLPPGHEATLQGLGDLLERHEGRQRKLSRRIRQGPVREGFGVVDPWYDGRNPAHDYSIIDTPIGGTVLDKKTVWWAVESFWTGQ